jgi:hypothetical protein
MFQKYEIERNSTADTLSIREYAVIEKHLQNTGFTLLQPQDYSLLHEQTYEDQSLLDAVGKGISAVVKVLRTPFFYPDASTAADLARSVVELYQQPEGGSTELFYNQGGRQLVDERQVE